jgi:hypothetical protein
MADTPKDTIYIDVDDEITTVIDKVLSSKSKIVALVLPKRAAVFQSIVNMKLLKLKTDNAGKNLVLITTESSLLPLAGNIGLYVAKTLASKPEIPEAPDTSESMIEADEDEAILLEDDKPDIDLKSAAVVPVGELESGVPSRLKNPNLDNDIETIELDNQAEAPELAADAAAVKPTKPKKQKKDKKLSVPNFERFRLLLIIGVLAIIIIIVLFYLAVKILPKATINISTDAQNVNANVSFILSTSAQSLSGDNVPAKQVSETKTYTATVNATGQQNNGQEANGTVTMTAEECGSVSQASDVPAGVGITQNGDTYITQGDTSFSPTKVKNGCIYFNANSVTDITAQNGGSSYNVSNGTFTVPGRTDITATGSASGGTDDIVTTVSQADITNATNKITTNNSGAKSDLTTQLNQANYMPISETFSAGTPTISPNTTAGTAASSVTVTETVVYTMYGVRQSDLKTLLDNNITSQVSSDQGILSDGLSNASYSSTNGSSPTDLTLQTTAEVGPNINIQTIKEQAVGKKSADIEALVKENPDVTNVNVNFSPFFVSTAPSNLSKITVNIAKPTSNAQN